MPSFRMLIVLAAATALGACSVTPSEAPTNADKKAFCAAYLASKPLYDRAPGAAVKNWDSVRASMDKIHASGTPSGSDGKARAAVLRISDIATNAKDATVAGEQVDAYFDHDKSAKAAMTGFYGTFCK